MKCLECDSCEFEERDCRFTPELKGEEFEVVVSAFVCVKCGTPLMDDTQMSVLRRATADKYRAIHGLLTSEEIIRFRSSFGMSQAAFASYLKVGEASIKRWETYFIQDVSQDEHIRLKCDEAYAELNALNVSWKSHPPDEYSGYRSFSWEFFKQAACYLVQFAPSPLFLNKALFYFDFKCFQQFGRSCTGARYAHLEYGPCPDQYQNLIQAMLQKELLAQGKGYNLKTVGSPDLSVFEDAEREVLQFVGRLAKEDSGEKLLKLSHKEEAYKKTKSMQLVSYEFAKHLKI